MKKNFIVTCTSKDKLSVQRSMVYASNLKEVREKTREYFQKKGNKQGYKITHIRLLEGF